MRIGIFDPYLNDLGGGEKYMITLAECLSKGNSVDVFWDNKEDLSKVAERFALDISKISLRENIFSSKYPFLKRCLNSLEYDVIIVLSDGSIPFLLCKKLFIHFQQPFPNVRVSLKTSLKKMRVNSFFCNSIFTKSFIDKEFGITSEVIYPPVNVDFKKSKKENIILHVGRFRAINIGSRDYKKQEIMVDVFKKMVDRGLKDWKFILAVGLSESDESKFNKLKEKAKGYPIEIIENPANEILWNYYSRSKIYWHASGYGENLDKNPELAEHFGISTVEAMAAGVVPVVINAGGQKEIVINGKSGYLWTTPEDCMEKTNDLIINKELMKEMSANAKERANKFAGERFCKELKEIIV